MLKRNLKIIIILFLAFSLTACAGLQLGGPDDSVALKQDKAHMVAVKEFALTLQDYNRHYAMADEATQAEWKAKYDPVFREANKVLDDWETALDNNWDPATMEQTWLSLKARLLSLMLNVKK